MPIIFDELGCRNLFLSKLNEGFLRLFLSFRYKLFNFRGCFLELQAYKLFQGKKCFSLVNIM